MEEKNQKKEFARKLFRGHDAFMEGINAVKGLVSSASHILDRAYSAYTLPSECEPSRVVDEVVLIGMLARYINQCDPLNYGPKLKISQDRCEIRFNSGLKFGWLRTRPGYYIFFIAHPRGYFPTHTTLGPALVAAGWEIVSHALRESLL